MPRGRPRQFDDDALLDATADALVDLGYADLTMDEIARRAGTSKQTLYARHGDKRALVDTCTSRACDRMHDHLVATYLEARTTPLAEQVAAGMAAVATFAAAHPRDFALINRVDWPDKYGTLEQLQARLTAEVARSIELESDDIDRVAAEDLAALLVALGWRAATRTHGEDPGRVRRLSALASALALRGLDGLGPAPRR